MSMRSPRDASTSEAPLPLAGIRVVDLTASWAGPFATQLLGDLGAEVIKVENTHVFVTMSRGHQARPTKEMLAAMTGWSGGYPDSEPGDRPWNRSPSSIPLFRNKRAMTCDLRTPCGLEVFGRLVAISDVVYENSTPGVMEKLGITWEWLQQQRPDIIYLRAPGFGLDVPRRDYRAVGSSIEALIGHTLLRGYPDLDPSTNSAIYPSDAFSGVNGAFHVLAALNHRLATGVGQLIEMPQTECSLPMFSEALMDYSLNGRVQRTIGNRDTQGAAPSGVYPCAGDDRWIAITVTDDAEWQALCDVLGQPDAATDPRFATALARREHQDDLDALLPGWTAGHDALALAWELQAAGVAAGPAMDAADCYRDPHLADRRFFERVTHPATGTYDWPGVPFQMSDAALRIRMPPADLGADNRYVYRDLLGYSAEEYEDLEREGHIGTEFDPDIP